MTDTFNRTWVQVHLDRLDHNVKCIRDALAPGAQMMCIIKADAYGNGAVEVARRLVTLGVNYFGVSNVDEAVELRNAGITQPILVISYTPPTQVVRLAEYNITQTVVSAEHAQELSDEASRLGVTLTVHIKVDTGMSRVGFSCYALSDAASAAEAIARVCRLPSLDAEGIFTHFASADEKDDGGFTEGQFERLMAVINALGEQGITFKIRHCCNSAATLRYPYMHLDMVRPGIILHGVYTDAWMSELGFDLLPVTQLKTTISMVKDLPSGTPVSYNRTYAADTPTRVATVPLGYADGFSRRLSNRGVVLVCGQRVPVIGRVCMDQCLLDVTDVPDAKEGSVVTILGCDGDEEITADELCATIGTINHELLCMPSRRVPRRYFDNGEFVKEVNYLL